MDPVDGNAIGAQLIELFGQDMTAEQARCEHCGAVAPLAEIDVYDHAPGVVARCRTCAQVILVITDIRATLCVHLHLELVGRSTASD